MRLNRSRKRIIEKYLKNGDNGKITYQEILFSLRVFNAKSELKIYEEIERYLIND